MGPLPVANPHNHPPSRTAQENINNTLNSFIFNNNFFYISLMLYLYAFLTQLDL